MKYQIDQSIKIENTSKTTYVSIANGQTVTVSISAGDKRRLKLFFRELGKPLIFKIFTFSVLCTIAIVESKTKSVTIDCEYVGHERQIKSFILQILRIKNLEEISINFVSIGKSSRAHKTVYSSQKNKLRGIKVTVNQVISYYDHVNKA